MCSNFWMALTHGKKRWTTFHPDDAPLLSPEFDDDEQIDRFRPLDELEADPATRASVQRARRLDFTLCEGEVLYIPHGTPHEVANLSATVSVSANFIDETNVAATLRQGWDKAARLEAGSLRRANLQTIMEALEEIQWPSSAREGLLDAEADAQCQPPSRLVGRFEAHKRVMRVKPVKIGCGYARELAG